jgi:hypothetical protein
MSKIRVQASAEINARPEQIYAVISDYQVGHPAILPKPPFVGLEIEKGGRGAGTLMWTTVKMWGFTYKYHHLVTEPEPGRVLVETDVDTGQFSSFTIDSLDGGSRSRVTIYSELPSSPGILGWMERLTQPSIIGGLFKRELRILSDYVTSQKH